MGYLMWPYFHNDANRSPLVFIHSRMQIIILHQAYTALTEAHTTVHSASTSPAFGKREECYRGGHIPLIKKMLSTQTKQHINISQAFQMTRFIRCLARQAKHSSPQHKREGPNQLLCSVNLTSLWIEDRTHSELSWQANRKT